MEKIESENRIKIGSYQGKGCKFTLTKKLELGKYALTVSGLTIQQTQVEFEITEENREKIIQSVNLSEKTNELNEVTVYGNQRKFMKVESDKTTISIKENGL